MHPIHITDQLDLTVYVHPPGTDPFQQSCYATNSSAKSGNYAACITSAPGTSKKAGEKGYFINGGHTVKPFYITKSYNPIIANLEIRPGGEEYEPSVLMYVKIPNVWKPSAKQALEKEALEEKKALELEEKWLEKNGLDEMALELERIVLELEKEAPEKTLKKKRKAGDGDEQNERDE
ncbi:hypothetical protein EJ02DRAFT_420503 [Clathrospora elynae]|uniref:Uncharacterized protein n=1 Tax=Clathrospora elynae TaxID=706981 RepID=A0A6A5SW17_9PLEO|nr:hypothetical protein EJ02DRAFT_420503 [Clathrospora elynae]